MERAEAPPISRGQLDAAVERFVDLLRGGFPKEAEFQHLFTDYPFILSRSLPLRVEPNEIVPLGRPGKSEPDFLAFPRSAGQTAGHYGIIELKRPTSSILTQPRKNVLMLSRDAQTAISQSQTYGRELERSKHLDTGDLLILGNRGHIFVIMGLSREFAQKVGSEVFREQIAGILPAQCQLIPYDSLLRSFQATIPPVLHVVVPDALVFSEPEQTQTEATFAALLEQPGMTVPEIAEKIGIKQNYLYRVLPGLEQEGKVEKRGRSWHPTTPEIE